MKNKNISPHKNEPTKPKTVTESTYKYICLASKL